ncbi:MAG: SIMPL domain-containing protein [Alphaproteobacteria bacterium]|nr:SIMPL domain-containing protein [Alphaproteobacteria bacterium]
MPDQLRDIAMLLAAIVVAIGVAVAGKFIGDGFRDGRAEDRYVTVKGLAERDVRADLAIWPVRVTAAGNNLGAAQARIDRSVDALTVFLVGEGLAKNAITPGRVEVTDLLAQSYRPEGAEKARYILAQTVVVRTTEIDKVAAASARIGELVKLDVALADTGGPTYAFTGLNAIKPEMIAEATKSAREGAERFAADSNSRVGAIRRANQGVFTIGGTVDAAIGSPESSIDKRVRVVSTLQFYLED